MVAVDPGTKELIAIFEVKTKFDERRHYDALGQLQAYKKELDLPNLSSFLVTGDETGSFMVHHFIDENLAITIPELIPTFENLKNKSATSNKNRLKTERTNSIDNFKISCFSLVLIVAIITRIQL